MGFNGSEEVFPIFSLHITPKKVLLKKIFVKKSLDQKFSGQKMFELKKNCVKTFFGSKFWVKIFWVKLLVKKKWIKKIMLGQTNFWYLCQKNYVSNKFLLKKRFGPKRCMAQKKNDSRSSHGCFTGVSMMFEWCFKGVSWVFHCSYLSKRRACLYCRVFVSGWGVGTQGMVSHSPPLEVSPPPLQIFFLLRVH